MAQSVSICWWTVDPLPASTTVWLVLAGHLRRANGTTRANVPEWLGPHLVTHGRGTFETGYGKFELVAGDLFFPWPGIPHKFWENPEDPWEFYWVRVIGPGCIDLGRQWGASPESPVIHTAIPELAEESAKSLLDYWSGDHRQIHQGLALFHRFVAATQPAGEQDQAPTQTPESLIREATIIVETLLETGLNVAELARYLGVSRTKLWRVFLDETGISPVTFLRQKRLERAKSLLMRSSLTVSQIADACGFGSEKYFHQAFRESTGTSPVKWKRAQV